MEEDLELGKGEGGHKQKKKEKQSFGQVKLKRKTLTSDAYGRETKRGEKGKTGET